MISEVTSNEEVIDIKEEGTPLMGPDHFAKLQEHGEIEDTETLNEVIETTVDKNTDWLSDVDYFERSLYTNEDRSNAEPVINEVEINNSADSISIITEEMNEIDTSVNERKGVFGIKGSLAGHLMAGGGIGNVLYFDRNGNIALMNSYSGTGATDAELSYEAGIEVSFKATDVREMEGPSAVTGVGGDLPGLSPGVNYEYSMGEDNNVTSHSFTGSFNLSVSPAEFHGGASNNQMKWRVNYIEKEAEYHGNIFGKKFKIEYNDGFSFEFE